MTDIVKQLVEVLSGLDEAYCRVGDHLTREERAEDRKRLMAARATVSAAKAGGWAAVPEVPTPERAEAAEDVGMSDLVSQLAAALEDQISSHKSALMLLRCDDEFIAKQVADAEATLSAAKAGGYVTVPELPEPAGELRSDEFEGHVFVPTSDDWPFEALYTADQMRAYALATLQAQPAAVSDVLVAFDEAVAKELPRVSHVEYDSHEICKHFAEKLRASLAMRPAQQAVPMTEAEMIDAQSHYIRSRPLFADTKSFADGIRYAEVYHGITAQGAGRCRDEP